jgi:hypothetical protein
MVMNEVEMRVVVSMALLEGSWSSFRVGAVTKPTLGIRRDLTRSLAAPTTSKISSSSNLSNTLTENVLYRAKVDISPRGFQGHVLQTKGFKW